MPSDSLNSLLVELLRGEVEHRVLGRRERPHFLEEAIDRRIAVRRDQRVQRLHQVPRGLIEARRERRVHVARRAAAPLLAARDQVALDVALVAERDDHAAVPFLRGLGHEHADALRQRGAHFGREHDLREVRRADFFLAFRDQHQVDGNLAAGAADRMQRREERRLRAFLIHGAAAHHDLAALGHVDEARFPRRRRPFLRVDLLHVVHEVQPERALRAGVERGEHARMTLGLDALGALEAGVEREPPHHVAAFRHADVLGGDRADADPLLQPLDGFVVAALDLLVDGLAIGSAGGAHGSGQGGASASALAATKSLRVKAVTAHLPGASAC